MVPPAWLQTAIIPSQSTSLARCLPLSLHPHRGPWITHPEQRKPKTKLKGNKVTLTPWLVSNPGAQDLVVLKEMKGFPCVILPLRDLCLPR